MARRVKVKGFNVSVLGFGFGTQWDPAPREREVIRRLVTHLEDERVLYVPFHLKVPRQVTESVQEIRAAINVALNALPEGSSAIDHCA
jgi:hypothetical protein